MNRLEVVPGSSVLVEDEDYEDLTPIWPYCEKKIQSDGVVMIKALGWRRWQPLTKAITGTDCAHRDGDFLNCQRDNLIPAGRMRLGIGW